MTYGYCASCKTEQECPKDNLNQALPFIAMDWVEKNGDPYFICKCGGKAYIYTDPDADAHSDEFGKMLDAAANAKPMTMKETFDTISKQRFRPDTMFAVAPCRKREIHDQTQGQQDPCVEDEADS